MSLTSVRGSFPGRRREYYMREIIPVSLVVFKLFGRFHAVAISASDIAFFDLPSDRVNGSTRVHGANVA